MSSYTWRMIKRTWPIPPNRSCYKMCKPKCSCDQYEVFKLKQQILLTLPAHSRLVEVFTPSGRRYLRLAKSSVLYW